MIREISMFFFLSSAGTALAAPTPAGESHIELKVACFDSFVPEGLKSSFEKKMLEKHKLAVKVTWVRVDHDDDMFGLIRSRKADIICPAHTTLKSSNYPYIAGNQAMPIDLSRLRNHAKMASWIKELDAVKENGRTYAVPVDLGTYMLVYDSRIIKERPASWNELFEPAYKDRLTVTGAYFEANVMITALSLGFSAKDMYDYDKVSKHPKFKERLEHLSHHSLHQFGGLDAVEHFEGSVIGTSWGGALADLNRTQEVWKVALPKEGVVAWADTWMVAKRLEGSPSMSLLAHEWIDWSLGEEYQQHFVSLNLAPVTNPLHENFMKKRFAATSLDQVDSFFFSQNPTQRSQNGFKKMWEAAQASRPKPRR